jgi:hypothetical protein
MKNQKGQIGNITGIISALVIVGLILGVGFLVLGEFKDTLSEDVHTVTNETTRAVVTKTGVYMAYNSTTAGVTCYNAFNVVGVYNQSGAAIVINSANYSFDEFGKIWSTTSGVYNNTLWNVTYTYQDGDEDCESVESTIGATTKVNDFIPIIVILLLVGILLAILFGALKFSGRDSIAQA